MADETLQNGVELPPTMSRTTSSKEKTPRSLMMMVSRYAMPCDICFVPCNCRRIWLVSLCWSCIVLWARWGKGEAWVPAGRRQNLEQGLTITQTWKTLLFPTHRMRSLGRQEAESDCPGTRSSRPLLRRRRRPSQPSIWTWRRAPSPRQDSGPTIPRIRDHCNLVPSLRPTP